MHVFELSIQLYGNVICEPWYKCHAISTGNTLECSVNGDHTESTVHAPTDQCDMVLFHEYRNVTFEMTVKPGLAKNSVISYKLYINIHVYCSVWLIVLQSQFCICKTWIAVQWATANIYIYVDSTKKTFLLPYIVWTWIYSIALVMTLKLIELAKSGLMHKIICYS